MQRLIRGGYATGRNLRQLLRDMLRNAAQFTQISRVQMVLNQVRQALDITLAQRVIIHRLHILQAGPPQQCTARSR